MHRTTKYYALCAGLLVLTLAGCGKLNESPLGEMYFSPGCMAFDCHVSTELKIYPPVSGAHLTHMRRGMGCDSCHRDYNSNILHRNGFINGYHPIYGIKTPGDIVFFDSTITANSDVSFSHSTGNCSMSYFNSPLVCHNGGRNWYASGCGACHAAVPGLGSYPPATGAHAVHRYENVACQTCHYQYTTTPAYPHNDGYINGSVLDPKATVTPTTIVYFDPARTTGSWNVGTADCTVLGCHGDKNWYAYPNSSNCAACHRYPPLNQAAPLTGRHTTHDGYPCSTCHNNYAFSNALHNNEIINGSNFDPLAAAKPYNVTNLSGGGLFNQATADCSGTGGACHGGDTPNWYFGED